MGKRFDVRYGEHGPDLDYHFCREWDENGGCYGGNKDHGLSFDEAVDEIAKWYEAQTAAMRDGSHSMLTYFLVEAPND